MDQKRLWISFVLALTVYLLPQSSAQCSLDLGVPFVNIGGVPFQGLFPEYTPSSFIQNGLTYLCYTRSETNSETFSEIRVSVLYQYQGTDGALQLTLSCIGSRWLYDSTQPSLLQLSAADHVTENMTREGCANCRDSSTTSFGDPTYCSLPDPCTEPSPVCENGGTCTRTGLTELACQCAGSWNGMGCTECNVTCSLEETVNEMMCSCEPRGPTAPPLSPGAIVGIVIACFALLAVILAIIAVVVIILVVDRRSRHNHV